jgi:hypothetical protein
MSETMHKAPTADRGVIYVASGDKSLEEAQASLATLRATNPGLEAMLLTDQDPPQAALWDKVMVDPALKGLRNRAKLHMDRAPWEKCLFLDTDTRVCGDLSAAFTLLDRFDFAGEHGHGGHHYEYPGLPTAFPEVNSGVLLWRRNECTAALFAKWRELYDADEQEYAGRRWDQKSLRIAVWLSDVRFVNLPRAYNLMPYFPSALEGRVYIAHGRSMANLERLEERMAVSDELRAYVPGLGALLHPRDMSWCHVFWTMWRLLAMKVCSVIRR